MAVDMFLKLGDLKGESQVRGFENQIQLLSWEWGMTQTGTMHRGSGGGTGKVNVQDLTFEHYLDAATPSLVAACCTGAHFSEATLTLRKAGGSALDYYVIKLTDIIVSAVSAEDNAGEELVKEWVGLNFAAFEVTYQPQDQKGAKRGGAIVKQYDIAKDSGSYFSPPRAAAVVNGEAQLEEQYKKGNEAFDYVVCASTTGRGNDEVLRHTVFGVEMSRVVLQSSGAVDFRITRNRIGLNAAIRSGLQGCVPPPSDALKTFLQKASTSSNLADPTGLQYLYSPVVQVVVDGSYAVGVTQSWDAFVRQSYDQVNQAISRQANVLLQRGNISAQEARALVEGQRNALVMQMRQQLSPWGRIYSELLKPSNSLPTLEQLVARKGSIEAVLTSVGKSRTSVTRFAATVRVAGPAAIIIHISLSGVIIARAAPQDQTRVASGQAGSIVGGAAGGAGGAWAGCLAGAALLSPSLVLPVVGEIGTGSGCLIGGIAGAFGLGAAGAAVGERAGTATYDFVTRFEWKHD